MTQKTTAPPGRVKSDLGPYAVVPLWLIEAGTSAQAVRLFALLAAKYADRDGDAWPARKTLAVDLACSETTVKEALTDLETAGALQREARYRDGDGGRTSNRYSLRFLPPADQATDPGRSSDRPRTAERPTGTRPIELDTKGTEVPFARPGPNPPKLTVKIDGGRRLNLVFDAIVDATGSNPRIDVGRITSAMKNIRRFAFDELWDAVAMTAPKALPLLVKLHAEGDVRFEERVADEVRRRAELYRARWPNIDITPTALSSNWALVVKQRPGGWTGDDIRRVYGLEEEGM